MRQKSFAAILMATILVVSAIAIVHDTADATHWRDCKPRLRCYTHSSVDPGATVTVGQNSIIPVQPNRGSDHIVPAKTGGETTSLSLDSVGRVHEGSTVEFTGKLISQSGKGVAKANIVIVDYSASPRSSQHDPTSDSKELVKAITDSDGFFKAAWVAKAKITSEPTEAYAEFDGNSKLLGSKSSIISITVVN